MGVCVSPQSRKENGRRKGKLTDDAFGTAALAELVADVAAAEEEDIVVLDRVLFGAPLVARRDQDETLTDVQRLQGLERETSIAAVENTQRGRSAVQSERKERDGDSPFAVNGQAALALEAHLLVAATDVLAFALVAALVLLLAALVRDCEKKARSEVSVADLESDRKGSD